MDSLSHELLFFLSAFGYSAEIVSFSLLRQKSKEQRIWESYRRFYGKKVVEFSIAAANSLINAFAKDNRDYSRLKQLGELDVLQQQLFQYFETHEIDRLFNAIRDFTKLKKEFIDGVDYSGYDWEKNSRIASYLTSEFQEFCRVFDIR